MFGFFVKKAFFDGWDNLLGLGLANLASLIPLALLALAGVAGLPAPLTVAVPLLAGYVLCLVHALDVQVTQRFADYASFPLAELGRSLRSALLPALQEFLIVAAVIIALVVGLPFWLAQGGLAVAAAGILLWVAVGTLLALQYYLPLRYKLGGGFIKNVRKSLLLLVDNLGFTILLGLWSIVSLALSVALAFLAPGVAGISLGHNAALRLLLLKYDFIETGALPEEAILPEGAQPVAGSQEARRRLRLPWKLILAGEIELVGKRTLRGMIFPWKE